MITETKKEMSNAWKQKLTMELNNQHHAIKINIPINTIDTIELNKQIKKFTNQITEYNQKIKYWLITENNQTSKTTTIKGVIWKITPTEIKKLWKTKEIYITNYINNKTINYLIKHIEQPNQINWQIITSEKID